MGQVKMKQMDTPLGVPAGFVYLLAILMLRSRRTQTLFRLNWATFYRFISSKGSGGEKIHPPMDMLFNLPPLFYFIYKRGRGGSSYDDSDSAV